MLETAEGEPGPLHSAGEPLPAPSRRNDAERRAARKLAVTSRHLARLHPQPPAGPEEAEKHYAAKRDSAVPVGADPRRLLGTVDAPEAPLAVSAEVQRANAAELNLPSETEKLTPHPRPGADPVDVEHPEEQGRRPKT